MSNSLVEKLLGPKAKGLQSDKPSAAAPKSATQPDINKANKEEQQHIAEANEARSPVGALPSMMADAAASTSNNAEGNFLFGRRIASEPADAALETKHSAPEEIAPQSGARVQQTPPEPASKELVSGEATQKTQSGGRLAADKKNAIDAVSQGLPPSKSPSEKAVVAQNARSGAVRKSEASERISVEQVAADKSDNAAKEKSPSKQDATVTDPVPAKISAGLPERAAGHGSATALPSREAENVESVDIDNTVKAPTKARTAPSMPVRRVSKAAELIAAKKAEMAGAASGGKARLAGDIAPAVEKPVKKKIEELSNEDVLLMVEEAGALLTGPGGAYERRPEQRELMALFENGLFLVSRSHIDDPHVVSFAGLLRRKGMTIELIPSEISVISQCYDASDGNQDQVVKADDEATSMQRDIVRFIAECSRLKASDAHVVVNQGSARVRLRIDGILKDFVEWRAAYGMDFCAAAFAMADASDASYQPYEYQAARISDTSVRLPGGVQALRLQFNPLSYGGRHMVARFLYRTQGVVGDVDTLGYAEKQIVQIKRMRAVPMGINIVAGPTGSGKSTTLQRILSTLMRERKGEISVFTVEDPPEYVIEGAQQMPVTNASTAEERKEKFNAAIRAALRSDPDVIMIGEIRDSESAKLAFEAAMTGHQVWATLHAVDALTIVSRLKDIGVDAFKLYDPAVFTGLVGQRLTRALCDDCKIPLMKARDAGDIDDELWERILDVYSRDVEGIFIEGPGCPNCKGTGVTGRSVVAEVVLPDDAFMEHMKVEDKLSARRHWIEHLNGITMMGHGILKSKAGVCSPQEVERMLGPLQLDRSRVRKMAAE